MAETNGASHYGGDGLTDRITTALAEAGLLGRRLSPADLAPLDQFHTRGMAATVELAAAAHIAATDTVLDVGSGLGGPSRTLASTFGCSVTGIDLAPSFVEAAGMLSELAGLADRVRYRCADALAMPFADASFDVAWSQHVAMNIADRAGLYAEIHRVLKPGGRFATYDVVAGSGEPLHVPVPWSAGPDTSFLLRADAMRDILERQGFRVENWVDRTADAVAWVGQQQARAKVGAGGPTLGLHLAMGPEFPRMAANLGRNLLEGRVGIQQAVLVRT
ncbi:MAG: class I SAM-dependent methyltransferase [Janthinobacterium lividum]